MRLSRELQGRFVCGRALQLRSNPYITGRYVTDQDGCIYNVVIPGAESNAQAQRLRETPFWKAHERASLTRLPQFFARERRFCADLADAISFLRFFVL